jgi:hypothetical protein
MGRIHRFTGRTFTAHVAANKHELRTFVPDAAYRFLKENAGAAGIGECIGVVCLAYQKHAAMDDRLARIERYLFELLDCK